ncbi:acetylornithine transaminase [Gracilibacillus caseinilyticus]|uniref:Acetylornithine aminotransferase n=1 Tax=Gracilibacillus caseinilyticus TaxID=2932256 RepID=A0ABY4F1D7_9BACI|nr:acetylornithine transaminase [Gracilibacillus caseinilyticus]UOQ50015.1 acetylornithine transaminase [Gracilibacillus caseinilyticus]
MSNQTETLQPVMQTYGRFPITLVEGKGSYVWDDQGTKYLDYTSGIATCNLGHVPEPVEKAVSEQLTKLWHCSNLYHIPSQEKLAKALTDNSCGDQVFFCNSGAEANEAAIKIAKKYGHDVLKQDNPLIITFQNSFHGRTMATLSATGQQKIQDGFAPLTPGFQYLPYNDQEALQQLSALKPAAVLLELVQGEGGVIPVDVDWIKELSAICKENDILLMIDEIQTGIGRTGKLFSYQHYQIEPDVFTIAKGLGSGFAIGAMVAQEHVAKVFTPGTHGSTFGGNPMAATAGLATIKHVTENNVLEKANEVADVIWSKLEELVSKKSQVKSVRGQGLLIGLEVEGNAIDYVNKAREEQQLLIVVAGPSIVRILPPLTTTETEVEHFIKKMEQVFS